MTEQELYVDSGIVAGDFVEEIQAAVDDVKTMKRTVKEFMTFEMILLENRMEGRAEGRDKERENFAFKMLRKGKALDEILELTELPLKRIKEIAAENSIEIKVS